MNTHWLDKLDRHRHDKHMQRPLRRGMLLLAVLAMPGAAVAQLSALKGHDTKAPVDVTAKHFEVHDKERMALFVGDVHVDQGDLKMASNEARVFYTRDSSNVIIRRVDAQGAVVLTSPSEQAHAAWGIYDVETEQVTLGGNVILLRGSNEVRGQRLELNLRSGLTTLDAAPTTSIAKNDPNARDADGRVRARFTVPERQKTP